MNGLKPIEPDYSEFVEVDPTGRYGRVCMICIWLISFLFWYVNLFTSFFCSTMKSLGKVLQRQCMKKSLGPFHEISKKSETLGILENWSLLNFDFS